MTGQKWLLIAVTSMVCLTGCELKERPPQIQTYRDAQGVGHVGRVVFVQLGDAVGYPEIARKMTLQLKKAILRKGLFHIDVITLDHPDLRDLNIPMKREPYTLQEILTMAKAVKCDALMVGRVNAFKPYPSTQIGLYIRLIDLKEGKLLWAVDDIWDSTSRDTVERIKRFYFDEMRDTYDPARAEMGIMSISGFQKFVASEIVNTIADDPNMKSQYKAWRTMRKFGRHQDKFWNNVREDL